MTATDIALKYFVEWYSGLTTQKDGMPARGAVAAALVVLDHLKDDYNLAVEAHLAKGGAQISGVSGAAVARILARFDETRPFVKEGGRTNRGGPGIIAGMLSALAEARLDQLTQEERVSVLTALQEYLAGRVRDYHNRKRVQFGYNPSQSAWQSVRDILDAAHKTGKDGPVAQYLVGAKLQLRFPDIAVGNESYSTADDQLGRPGDFYIGDTAFHVTATPMPPLYEKCKKNLSDGYRVYLLVPDSILAGTRQNAELAAPGRISVQSIESFVSQNVEELSHFEKDRLAGGFRALLDKYNERVDATELDKSMLIEIPRNLPEASENE